MTSDLHQWRKRNNLTQVDAAVLLGVSQPYLSLIEKGARHLTATLRNRMKGIPRANRLDSAADRLREQLSALRYPGFAHVTPSRRKTSPDALLASVLSQTDADARVVEALPWLVRQAKLQNLQNRLGFVLQTAGVETPELSAAVHELERARLLQEATLCWDSMPAATRKWMRANRSPLAEYWNVVTRLRPEPSSYAD